MTGPYAHSRARTCGLLLVGQALIPAELYEQKRDTPPGGLFRNAINCASWLFGYPKAAIRTWTGNLLITNQLLYQLSYDGIWLCYRRDANLHRGSANWAMTAYCCITVEIQIGIEALPIELWRHVVICSVFSVPKINMSDFWKIQYFLCICIWYNKEGCCNNHPSYAKENKSSENNSAQPLKSSTSKNWLCA